MSGLGVARALEARTERMRAKVIEKNRTRAENAADGLERTIVLNGDGMDMDILLEAGIDRADAVLAVTDDDKTNLLVAVRAKQAGCPMAIALVNDPTLVPLMGALDIDAYHQPARDHRVVDPAAYPPWAGAVDLFHRRCRGRDDRGAGAVHLAAGGQADPEIEFPGRRAGGRGDEGRQGSETDRRSADGRR